MRHQADQEALRPAVGVLMLGVATAFAADFPVLLRSVEGRLSRTLDEAESAVAMLAYATFLFEACSRVADATFAPRTARALKLQLQVEFPALMSSGSETVMSADDWIEATQAVGGQLGASARDDREAATRLGSLIAQEVGAPGDPEIVGQVAVMAAGTLAKLQPERILARIRL